MKIEFYKPSDEYIPTRLRLKVDGTIDVYYKQVHDSFAYDFEFYNCPEGKESEILDRIVSLLCNQSYDHGSEWREIRRELLPPKQLFDNEYYRVYFQRMDSY